MGRTTSYNLGDDLDAFISDKVASGSFKNASEVVRTALQRMLDEERKEEALLSALDLGLRSKRAAPGVSERVRAKVAEAMRKRNGAR